MGKKNQKALDLVEQDKKDKMDEILKKAEDKISDRKNELKSLVANRQAVINPYANMTNEMANLGVATQAAEFQAEESDIALANTLDTMAASGASAGGATALAMAALKSKRGISASLQQQEAANQKKAAEGADAVQKMKAQGEMQKFKIQDARDEADVNRAANELANQNARVDAANASLLELQFDDTL